MARRGGWKLNNDRWRQLVIDDVTGKSLADAPFLGLTGREAAVMLLGKSGRTFAAPEFCRVVLANNEMVMV